MDELENKKWIISRIDRTIPVYEEFLKKDQEDLRKFIDKEINNYKNVGKGGLALAAFFITLVFAIAQIDQSFGNPVSIVLIILFLAIVFYFITLVFEARNEAILSKIVQSFVLARIYLYQFRGFYESATMKIEAFTPDDYHKLEFYLSQYIYSSSYLGPFYATKNALKLKNRIFLSLPTNKMLENMLVGFKTMLDNAATYYEKEKQGFENIKLIEPVMGYGNLLLDYKKGNEANLKKYFEGLKFDFGK